VIILKIKDKGYLDFLPNLYAVKDSYDQIKYDNLPNSFAIKCNNGSGTNVFISYEEMATAEDFSDYLLRTEKISSKQYDEEQGEAKELLKL